MDICIFTQREEILSNSIFSDMGEMILALDRAAVTSRGSSFDFTIELHPAFLLGKGVDYRLALISSDIRGTISLETTIYLGTMWIRIQVPPGASNITAHEIEQLQ